MLPPPAGSADESDHAAEGREPCSFGTPSLPEHHVSRPRLMRTLDQAAGKRLVVVSAAAGTGKTSVVAEWASSPARAQTTDWVTFECDEHTFWPGLMGCLERLGVPVSERAFSEGTSSQSRRLLTQSAAAVAGHPVRVAVVLDGYELLAPAMADDLDFLLRHSGGRLQLVMITRTDPVLPLYRYRLEGSLVELRTPDLAFTEDETVALLDRAGVVLSDVSLRALVRSTAGWATGLRFAVGTLVGRTDLDTAVGQITGEHGNIAEYLLGEVLDAQSPGTRELLLRTSVPDVIRPGLATALAGHAAGRGLVALSKQNAFIEPVPEHPGRFRYHPFFRTLLRAELAYEGPEVLSGLHRIAAAWFADEGMLDDAVGHYLAIGSSLDAARCVIDHLAVAELILSDSTASLPRALGRIKSDAADPSVWLVREAMALSPGGPGRFADGSVHAVEWPPEPTTPDRAMVIGLRTLQMVHARYWSSPQAALDRAGATAELLGPAPDASYDSPPELRALVHVCRGAALFRLGRRAEARASFEAAAGTEAPVRRRLQLESLGNLALLAGVEGHVSDARELVSRADGVGEGVRPAELPAALLVARAWVDVERHELGSARRAVEAALDCDDLCVDPVSTAWLDIVTSRLLVARGDTGGALRALAGPPSAVEDGWLGDHRRLERAHVRLTAGSPSLAEGEVAGLEDAYPVRVALVRARAQLALGADAEVEKALRRVLVRDAPVDALVWGWLVESARQRKRGSPSRAEAAMDRARRLADDGQLRRPFESTTPELLPLHDQPSGPGLPRQRQPSAGSLGDDEPAEPLPVIDKLTPKELEVLTLFAELLSTQEVAAQLCVSVNTIRTHVRSILRKLGVTRRNAAVRRARELELLAN